MGIRNSNSPRRNAREECAMQRLGNGLPHQSADWLAMTGLSVARACAPEGVQVRSCGVTDMRWGKSPYIPQVVNHAAISSTVIA